MPQNTLYIMTGLPYCGKSTLTKVLVGQFGMVKVSVDEIMDRENMWREGHPTQDDWNKAYSQAYEEIKTYLIGGKDVVFDCANLPFHERETPRLIAQNLGVKSKLIYLKVDKEEILRRRDANRISKERGHLEDREMAEAFRLFEEPGKEERAIIYNQTMDLDEWVKENIVD